MNDDKTIAEMEGQFAPEATAPEALNRIFATIGGTVIRAFSAMQTPASNLRGITDAPDRIMDSGDIDLKRKIDIGAAITGMVIITAGVILYVVTNDPHSL